MKPEPHGMVAPPALQGEIETLADLPGVLLVLRDSLNGSDGWQFPEIDEWKECFGSLEDAMPCLR